MPVTVVAADAADAAPGPTAVFATTVNVYVAALSPVTVWLTLVLLGYTGMFWALGVQPWSTALTTSGSSLFTLGFAALGDLRMSLLAFTEATIGLILIAHARQGSGNAQALYHRNPAG